MYKIVYLGWPGCWLRNDMFFFDDWMMYKMQIPQPRKNSQRMDNNVTIQIWQGISWITNQKIQSICDNINCNRIWWINLFYFILVVGVYLVVLFKEMVIIRDHYDYESRWGCAVLINTSQATINCKRNKKCLCTLF